MKRLAVPSGLLLLAWLGVAQANDPQAAVELHWPGKQLATPESQQQVLEKALQVLQSSNFNSNPGPGDKYQLFKLEDVQRSYRKEVAGRFLLISFPSPQKMHTVGGELLVSEIVIGLNGEQYASDLFTIDDSGRVVGHSKYSGVACVELLQKVRELTADP